VKSNPAVRKVCSPEEGYYEKRCEILSGSQEMAVIVPKILINNNSGEFGVKFQ